MLSIVTGNGPRVGSSFVMRQAKVRGLDVAGKKYLDGAPVAGNPGGYYDLDDFEVFNLKSGVGKVWPRQMRHLTTVPDRMVVLVRDRSDEAWIRSIEKQIKRENATYSVDDVLDFSEPLLEQCLKGFPGEVMTVATHQLDEQIDNIIKFIGDN